MADTAKLVSGGRVRVVFEHNGSFSDTVMPARNSYWVAPRADENPPKQLAELHAVLRRGNRKDPQNLEGLTLWHWDKDLESVWLSWLLPVGVAVDLITLMRGSRPQFPLKVRCFFGVLPERNSSRMDWKNYKKDSPCIVPYDGQSSPHTNAQKQATCLRGKYLSDGKAEEERASAAAHGDTTVMRAALVKTDDDASKTTPVPVQVHVCFAGSTVPKSMVYKYDCTGDSTLADLVSKFDPRFEPGDDMTDLPIRDRLLIQGVTPHLGTPLAWIYSNMQSSDMNLHVCYLAK
ncbi:hypothetical protein DIPPA_19758 [Diplonema papillatum]|nr:hypothetical protein DIPPA_19758 [Diplonema papillatum]